MNTAVSPDPKLIPLLSVPLPPVTVAWASDLPALPAAVLDLMALLGADDVDPFELSAKLSIDIALSAKTLRLANSSFYGLKREVTSVADAVSVLGLRMVKGLVTAAALSSSFAPPACAGFDFNAFWRESVATAVAAQALGFAVDADPQTAFTAGLLFNIGQLVLAGKFPERYAELLAIEAATGAEIAQLEHELLGIDHAQVGARVAEHWRFPATIVRAIAAQDGPLAPGAVPTLGQIVAAAHRLVVEQAHGGDPGVAGPGLAHGAWAAAGVGPELWTSTAEAAAAQTDAICAGLLG